MPFVFTSQDIRLRFVDGGRDGEKTEFEMSLAGADLLLEERSEPVFHLDRGRLDHRRKGEPMPMDGQLSWRYANVDIYEWIRENLSGVSTTSSGGNLCTAPNDYTDPAWTKNGVTVSDDGLAPDGETMAKRLTPTSAASYIEYSVNFTPALNERVYLDWWAKAPSSHQAKTEVSLSYHGSGVPPPDWILTYDVTPRWAKHTAGNTFSSDYVTEETMTVRFYPTTGTTEPLDLWEVWIRREAQEKKAWDLYVDFVNGSTDHTLVLQGVVYRAINMAEGEETSIFAMQFDAYSTGFLEV